jgi:hypothetical protein
MQMVKIQIPERSERAKALVEMGRRTLFHNPLAPLALPFASPVKTRPFPRTGRFAVDEPLVLALPATP